jgi:hypothetical protein
MISNNCANCFEALRRQALEIAASMRRCMIFLGSRKKTIAAIGVAGAVGPI